MIRIKAPNKRYNGETAGIKFINGIAETERETLKWWFSEKGYEIEQIPFDGSGVESLEELTVKELKEIAEERGIEGYKRMKKQELIETLAGD